MALKCIAQLVWHLTCTIHGSDPAPQRLEPLIYPIRQEVWYDALPEEGPKVASAPRSYQTAAAIPIPDKAPRRRSRSLPKDADLPKAKHETRSKEVLFRHQGTKEVAFAGGSTHDTVSAFERLLKPKKLKLKPGAIYALADGNEDMGCMKKNRFMIGVLRDLKAKYGKTVLVDSAYRSPRYNRKVRGAKKSLHMSCQALDVKIPGVSKDKLAAYLRSYPGMGGVGIYSSGSVHFDHGRRRNWDWR